MHTSSIAYRSFPALLTAVAATTAPAAAATLNTQWQTGYTGNEANTVLLWKFDGETQAERLNDSSPNNRDATLLGVASDLGVAGKFGTGLNVDVPNVDDSRGGVAYTGGSSTNRTALSNAVTSALTVEFWYKPDSTGLVYLADKKQASSLNWGFFLTRVNDDNLRFEVGNDRGSQNVTSTGLTWTPGQWYHIAGTFENLGDATTGDAVLSLWRDGVLLATKEIEDYGDIKANSRPFAIGDRETGTSGSGDARGVFDEVRISNVAYAFAIPEPSTAALGALGGVLCFARRLRRD